MDTQPIPDTQIKPSPPVKPAKIHYVLWTVQIILSILFLFSGTSKFFMSLADMEKGAAVHFPLWFYHFIGICEILGAIGLVLPSALKIKPYLTPVASLCLSIILIGAIVLTLMSQMPTLAVIPFVTLLLCLFIDYGRFIKYPIFTKKP